MASNDITIQFSDKALKFIRGRRLKNPLVLVSIAYQQGGSGGDGCGGGCGGGCSEGDSKSYVPCTNAVLVDGGSPSDDFAKVETQDGIPVFLSKAVLDKAKQSKSPLTIVLKGLVMKKLVLEGLDLTPSPGQDSQGGSTCH